MFAFGDIAIADFCQLAPGDDVVPLGAGVALIVLEPPIGGCEGERGQSRAARERLDFRVTADLMCAAFSEDGKWTVAGGPRPGYNT